MRGREFGSERKKEETYRNICVEKTSVTNNSDSNCGVRDVFHERTLTQIARSFDKTLKVRVISLEISECY